MKCQVPSGYKRPDAHPCPQLEATHRKTRTVNNSLTMAPSTTSTNPSSNLCTKGCGFFELEELCSLCYKEEVKKKSGRLEEGLSSVTELKQSEGEKQESSKEKERQTINHLEAFNDVDDQEQLNDKSQEVIKAPLDNKRAPKSRCVSCRRKLGLLGFLCRCGGQFCSLHRHSSEHQCGFDWRELGRREVARNNPLVRAQKVVRI